MALDARQTREMKSAVGVMRTQCLKHLGAHIIERALGKSEERLQNDNAIRFDTIPRVALEEVRAAYLAILDDPTALEALKKELRA